MSPPPQAIAAAKPAFLGPAFSSQCPKTAADIPKKTMAIAKVNTTSLLIQSHEVVKILWTKVTSGPHSFPISCVSWTQKILTP